MIQVFINTIDKSDHINWQSLQITQNLTNLVDVCSFTVRKYGDKTYTPSYNDDVIVYDGSTKIFAGKILKVQESVETCEGVVYDVDCVDHTYEFDKLLVGKTYVNKTIGEIISDIITNYTPAGSGFTSVNAQSTFLIDKIVFNQVRPSDCLIRLAGLLQYDWYIDEDKDIHFFSKETNLAPFDLTDVSGNFVYKSLKRNIDGSQLVNRVKVRGGEYDGSTYTDKITVSGSDTKSFSLPYKMSELAVSVNSVTKTVGIDFVDDFTSVDILHNYQSQSFRFENVLTAGDVIEFSGKPKIRVFAIAQNPSSVEEYGVIEKLIRENDINSNETARKRAQAELLAYSEKLVEASFITYNSGLRVGMNINVSSTTRGSNDNFLIKSITFSTIDPNNFIYKVSCVSTKTVDFIQLLQKIIKAEPLDIDEQETSEEIFALNEEVEIQEDIEVINPFEADESVEIEELTLQDPVDPDDVEFVLGNYTKEDPSLILKYHFNNNANDSSKNLLNGAQTGGSFVVGLEGYGYLPSNLTSDNINIANAILTSLFVQTGTFTVSCWVYQNSIGTNMNVWNWNGGSSNRINLNINGDIIGFQRYNGSSYASRKRVNYPAKLNKWTHIICINNAGNLFLYVDNVEATDSNNNYAVTNSGNILRIGYPGSKTDGSKSIDGIIDEFRIYSRVLNLSEIADLYNNPLKDFAYLDPKLEGRLDLSMQLY